MEIPESIQMAWSVLTMPSDILELGRRKSEREGKMAWLGIFQGVIAGRSTARAGLALTAVGIPLAFVKKLQSLPLLSHELEHVVEQPVEQLLDEVEQPVLQPLLDVLQLSALQLLAANALNNKATLKKYLKNCFICTPLVV